MRENFQRCFDFVMLQEVSPDHQQDGELHTAPGDPGGTTRWGLSKRWNPDLDLEHIDRAQAADVYLKRYWIPNGCDNLPWPCDLVVFDTFVNMNTVDSKAVSALCNGTEAGWDNALWFRLLLYWQKNRDSIKKTGKPRVGFEDWIKRMINLHAEIVKG